MTSDQQLRLVKVPHKKTKKRIRSEKQKAVFARACEIRIANNAVRAATQALQHEARKIARREERKALSQNQNSCVHARINCEICDPVAYLVQLKRILYLQNMNLLRIHKKSSVTQTRTNLEYLGCTPKYYKELMETKMVACMNWNNVHMDHIKPIKAFDLNNESELVACSHYSNMQPLSGRDNRIKKSKWSDADEIFWNANITMKEYLPIYIPETCNVKVIQIWFPVENKQL